MSSQITRPQLSPLSRIFKAGRFRLAISSQQAAPRGIRGQQQMCANITLRKELNKEIKEVNSVLNILSKRSHLLDGACQVTVWYLFCREMTLAFCLSMKWNLSVSLTLKLSLLWLWHSHNDFVNDEALMVERSTLFPQIPAWQVVRDRE